MDDDKLKKDENTPGDNSPEENPEQERGVGRQAASEHSGEADEDNEDYDEYDEDDEYDDDEYDDGDDDGSMGKYPNEGGSVSDQEEGQSPWDLFSLRNGKKNTGDSQVIGSCPMPENPGAGGLPLRWYLFFVNVFLPFIIVLSLMQLYSLYKNFPEVIGGIVYLLSSDPASGIYGLVTILSMFVLPILLILVFWFLRKFKLLGYRLYWVFFAAFIAFRILIIAFTILLSPESAVTELYPSLMIVFYGLNGIYLKKRRAIFV